jgi:hypothetical protein
MIERHSSSGVSGAARAGCFSSLVHAKQTGARQVLVFRTSVVSRTGGNCSKAEVQILKEVTLIVSEGFW